MISILKRYRGSLLLIILAFAYLTRVYQVHQPPVYVFDEVYHAVTAKLIARNDARAFEWWNPAPEPDTAVDWLHPPLAKYFQAISILAFGENSFGWRFSSVVFGTVLILLVYHLAFQLTKDVRVGLVAALLASLDGLLLVQSRIAMNDIHVAVFIVLTFLMYAKFREKPTIKLLLWTGVTAGLAVSSKWSGVFALMTVIALEFLRYLPLVLLSVKQKPTVTILRSWSKKLTYYVLCLLVVPAMLYIGSYFLMFAQGKDWAHFQELHNQIWYYQTNLKATHPYQSRPWAWMLNYRPVWYWVDYKDTQRADIYASGNSALFWLGLTAVVLSGASLIQNFIQPSRSRLHHSALHYWMRKWDRIMDSPLFMLVVMYFAVWLPWVLSPRIMFFYHYTPAVPLLSIVLAYWLLELWKKRGRYQHVAIGLVLLILLVFIVWYPHWIGWHINNNIKNAVYFSISSWK